MWVHSDIMIFVCSFQENIPENLSFPLCHINHWHLNTKIHEKRRFYSTFDRRSEKRRSIVWYFLVAGFTAHNNSFTYSISSIKPFFTLFPSKTTIFIYCYAIFNVGFSCRFFFVGTSMENLRNIHISLAFKFDAYYCFCSKNRNITFAPAGKINIFAAMFLFLCSVYIYVIQVNLCDII